MSQYFYTDGKAQYGPFSAEELRQQNITRQTKVWRYGMDGWTELINVPELNEVLKSIPPDVNAKSSLHRLRDETEIIPQSVQQRVQEIPLVKPKKMRVSIGIWPIASISIILLALASYFIINNRSEEVLMNEIIANSYVGDEDFDMYVKKFYRDLEFYGIHPKTPTITIIKFSRLDQMDNATHIHAVSLGSNDDDRIEIYINPSTWNQFSKPMKYFLMYHELAHDVLNLDDLEAVAHNEGKLMYPELMSYNNKTMDDFIESFHALFKEQSAQRR